MSTQTNLSGPGGHRPHPGGGSRHPLAGAALALACVCACACACSNSSAPTPSNPIDRILAPRLAALGLEMRSAEPHELCRRIAIDLLGRGPSPDELSACVAADGAAGVELAQSHDDYLEAARRAWAERFGYDAFLVWSADLADLDARVADLAAGRLAYADFATAAVTHPAFVALHPYDEWARAMIDVFLGRAAREDEVAALRPLSAAWHIRYLCEGGMWWGFYDELREEGYSERQATVEANYFCADEAVPQVGFNPCQCKPDDGLLGCHSTALGDLVNLPVRCAEPNRPYSAANAFLLGPAPGGDDDTCPDGVRRPECAVRETDESFLRLFVPVAWTPIDDEGRADLARIGAALTARPDFWEAAADRELRRLLGWWQTSFRYPDTDLPEVRALLAGLMQGGASVAEIERLIMTSQLYAAPSEAPPAWDRDGVPPPWSMGPTKLLAADAWIDTLLLAVGEKPGVCDVRGISNEGYAGWMFAPGELADPASSLDRVVGDEYYVGAVTALGGCMSESPRPTQSSVGLAFAQGEHARVACAYGEGVMPADGAVDLRAAAERLVRRLLARPADDGELDELVAEMEACLAAGAGGDQACTDPEYAVRWLCQRLADSTEFATY